jgi:hypothetical protein
MGKMIICLMYIIWKKFPNRQGYIKRLDFIYGNISGGNQPIRANYGNFNRSHMMLIQGKTYRRWKG